MRLHRVFFALWPDARFREDLGARTRRLDRVEGRRLACEDWHVTMCFIGGVSDTVLAALQASAATVPSAPLSLGFNRIEYWPEARVVAATASEIPSAAVELSQALRTLARSLGIAPDEKPLRPHLTLMRGVNPLAWQMNLDQSGASLEPALLFESDTLHLAESRATPHRMAATGAPGAICAAPSYVRLASWSLPH